MQHTTGSWEFFLGSMIQHFLNGKSKLKNKTLKGSLKLKRLQRYQKKTKIIGKGSAKRSKTSEERYKVYKTLFETLKKKSKKFYYSNRTDKYRNYMKKTRDVMTEIIRNSQLKIKKLPIGF